MKKTRQLLSLDIGTKMGWALATIDGSHIDHVSSSTKNFTTKRFEGGGMRYLKFKRWLEELQTRQGGIDEICFEEVRGHSRGAVAAAHAYGGFLSILCSWAEEEDIPYVSVPVGTIKKYATGKGNASKDMVTRFVKGLGYNPIDDNESDALALLHCYVSTINS